MTRVKYNPYRKNWTLTDGRFALAFYCSKDDGFSCTVHEWVPSVGDYDAMVALVSGEKAKCLARFYGLKRVDGTLLFPCGDKVSVTTMASDHHWNVNSYYSHRRA